MVLSLSIDFYNLSLARDMSSGRERGVRYTVGWRVGHDRALSKRPGAVDEGARSDFASAQQADHVWGGGADPADQSTRHLQRIYAQGEHPDLLTTRTFHVLIMRTYLVVTTVRQDLVAVHSQIR